MANKFDLIWFDSDIKFNSLKSTVTRTGEHFNVKCAPLIFDGSELLTYNKYNVSNIWVFTFSR